MNKSNRRVIYPPIQHYYGGTFHELSNDNIRQALEQTFLEIETQCEKWKTYVDLKEERNKMKYFDLKAYFIARELIMKSSQESIVEK